MLQISSNNKVESARSVTATYQFDMRYEKRICVGGHATPPPPRNGMQDGVRDTVWGAANT